MICKQMFDNIVVTPLSIKIRCKMPCVLTEWHDRCRATLILHSRLIISTALLMYSCYLYRFPKNSPFVDGVSSSVSFYKSSVETAWLWVIKLSKVQHLKGATPSSEDTLYYHDSNLLSTQIRKFILIFFVFSKATLYSIFSI